MTAAAPVVLPTGGRWPALLPIAIIAIPFALRLAGVDIANAWIIFSLLIGLRWRWKRSQVLACIAPTRPSASQVQ